MISFTIQDDYIQLDQLLKVCKIAENGSHAHQLVDDGVVNLNGSIETRRRAKVRKGDIVKVLGEVIKVG
jgi:ribosome-associated protein